MTQRPSPLKHTSLLDFTVSSGTSCTSQGFDSSTDSSLPPAAPATLSPMPDSEWRLTHSLSAKKFMSPLYVSLTAAWPPRCMTTDGNLVILNRCTMSFSSSETKPNFIVRLNTVSLDKAFQMLGVDFDFEKRSTFGLEWSLVRKSSTLSFVTFVPMSVRNLATLPEIAFCSSLPSYLKVGIGFGGLIITVGVVVMPCLPQNTSNSLQLTAVTLAMPFSSPATLLYSSMKAISALLSSL
mmetsp:Transcript_68426/g.110267  ORF Transcript_68426/g.110267 Transcript_68426/m.110267 type:complete len:238 (+) Transcript_68426:602-1315(+)